MHIAKEIKPNIMNILCLLSPHLQNAFAPLILFVILHATLIFCTWIFFHLIVFDQYVRNGEEGN